MKKTGIEILFIALVISLCSCEKKKTSCQVTEAKTLFTTLATHDTDSLYGHYILLKDFSRECLDSLVILTVANRYRDTIKNDRPARVLLIFNSEENFVPGETSQNMDEINKDCLVVIRFDAITEKPVDFIFYNKNGIRTYWGGRWLPNG